MERGVRFVAKGNEHSRPRLSHIPSRKAAVVLAWDSFSGSLAQPGGYNRVGVLELATLFLAVRGKIPAITYCL